MPESVNIDKDGLALLGAYLLAGHVSDEFQAFTAENTDEDKGDAHNFTDDGMQILFPRNIGDVVQSWYDNGGLYEVDEFSDLSEDLIAKIQEESDDLFWGTLNHNMENPFVEDGGPAFDDDDNILPEVFASVVNDTMCDLMSDYDSHLSDVGRNHEAERICRLDTKTFLRQFDEMLERYEYHYHAQKGWNLNATRRIIWSLEDARNRLRNYDAFISDSPKDERGDIWGGESGYDSYDFTDDRITLKSVDDYLAERESR